MLLSLCLTWLNYVNLTECMVTFRHHSLRASCGDWWVDIVTISTNEQTLWSLHQYHHYRWYCSKNIQLNILYCHYFFLMTTPCNGLPRYSGRAESCNLFGAENVAHIAHPSSDTLLGRCHELVWLRHFDICSFWLLSHFHTVAYAGIAANIISFDTKRAKTTSRRRFAALERAD